MKTLLKVFKWIGILLLVIVVVLFISGAVLYNKKYEAPMPDIKASTDSAIIAHGKHLIYSTAHCIECHFKPEDSSRVVNGEDAPLAGGGFPFVFPGGKFYSKNISSDPETGIGKLSDGEIARVLRHGVKSDGTALIPAMEFQNLSDNDVTAIISYLRTTPPVKYKVPENDFNLLGYAILAFFIRPASPQITPPMKVEPDTTAEYGKYIAESISSCRGCHTQRDMNTGKYIGEELAGGPVEVVDGKQLVAPNLTPDPETGRLSGWTFEQFQNRFRQGKLIRESIMPWAQFKNLNDVELKAIWKYLHTIKAVKQDNGPAVQEIVN